MDSPFSPAARSSSCDARARARTAPPDPGRRRCTSWRCRSGRRGGGARAGAMTTRRAPLIPSGWPIAMAPPLTLTRSGSSPSSRTTARDWEANASFSSTRSTSSSDDPGAREQLADGRDRADAHHARVDSGDGARDETRRAARAPSAARLLARWRRRAAAAPSLMPLELPAVTVPSCRNAGFSGGELLRRRVRPRMLVRSTVPRRATSSSSNRPAATAAAWRCWLASANASCSSRVTAYSPRDVLTRLAHRLEREHRLETRDSRTASRASCPRRSGFRAGRRGRACRARAARGSSTRRRRRRTARRHPPGSRGKRSRSPRARTRTAGSR